MSFKNCKIIGTNQSGKRVGDARIVGFDAGQQLCMTGSLQALEAEANYSRSLAEAFNVIQIDCGSSAGALERSVDATSYSLADGHISIVAGVESGQTLDAQYAHGFGRNRCVASVRPRPARYNQTYARAA